MAVRLRAEDLAPGATATVNWHFTDLVDGPHPADWLLGLENRALHYVAGRHDPDGPVTLRLAKGAMIDVLMGRATAAELIEQGLIEIDGDPTDLLTIFGNLEVFQSGFAIVEP